MKPSYRPLVRILALIAVAAPLSLAAQQPPGTRFRDPDHITGDPTGLHIDRSVHAFPRYPGRPRDASRVAVPVVAFVVDTLGRVEIETASFLNDPPPDFRDAVCASLPAIRFIPLVIDGQKMRVLLVESFGFKTVWADDSLAFASAYTLARTSQERFATQPVTAVIPELEARPHCVAAPEK